MIFSRSNNMGYVPGGQHDLQQLSNYMMYYSDQQLSSMMYCSDQQLSNVISPVRPCWTSALLMSNMEDSTNCSSPKLHQLFLLNCPQLFPSTTPPLHDHEEDEAPAPFIGDQLQTRGPCSFSRPRKAVPAPSPARGGSAEVCQASAEVCVPASAGVCVEPLVP